MFDELSSELGKILMQLSHLEDQRPEEVPPVHEVLRIGLVILDAETQFMIGHGSEALGKLLVLQLNMSTDKRLETTKDLGRNDYFTCYQKVRLSIVNMHIRQHQWTNAVAELKKILQDVSNMKETMETTTIQFQVLLLCKMARLFVHTGDIPAGEKYFEFAKNILRNNGETGQVFCCVEAVLERLYFADISTILI